MALYIIVCLLKAQEQAIQNVQNVILGEQGSCRAQVEKESIWPLEARLGYMEDYRDAVSLRKFVRPKLN